MASVPSITPYRSHNDLLKLRQAFYAEPENRKLLREAVNTVNVLRSRGKLPHAVDATAWLVSAKLSDHKDMEIFSLRSAYAMALVRFVNGMLDPFQQGAHAVALSTIAKSIGLTLSFVDLRHSATHGQLPSLELLRSMSEKALKWLFDHYWVSLTDVATTKRPTYDEKEKPQSVLLSLKIYKKLRKQHFDLPLSRENPILKSYWNCFDALVAVSKDPVRSSQMVEMLVCQNFLIKTEGQPNKFKTMLKIYSPLLEGCSPAFLLELVLAIIHHCSPLNDVVFTGTQIEQGQSWCSHLVSSILNGNFPIDTKHHKNLSKQNVESLLRTSLGLLEEDSPMVNAVENAIMQKPVPKRVYLPPSLDEILAPSPYDSPKEASEDYMSPAPKKRRRTELFQANPEWTLTPFGVCP
ncbi:putative rRNA-processing protein [Clavispora lusitaniae]|uniref:rRNA-processing protein n=1 Tax=Clavispora lusitaniae TaxID=36911 RepID=A0AA91T019_CLALS|nr:putative rRNA-processing protein [Clavispora lusitaniae]